MSSGKLAAQATHAGRLSLLQFIKHHPERMDEFLGCHSAGSVVTLRAPTVRHLEAAREQAVSAGLPCALFEDSGHVMLPHFDGSPVVTALAIGPAPRSAMRAITKKFQVVK